MKEPPPLSIQIVGSSFSDIRDLLGLPQDAQAGTECSLTDGATIVVEDISKTSGFDATTVILVAAISIATSTSREAFVDWLRNRLFAGRKSQAPITIVIDGKELQLHPG